MACMHVRININFPHTHAYHTSWAQLVTRTMNSYAEPHILDMSAGVTVVCQAIYFNPQQQCRGCSTVVEECHGACQWGSWTVLHSRTDHPGGYLYQNQVLYNRKVKSPGTDSLLCLLNSVYKRCFFLFFTKKGNLFLHMCRLNTIHNVNIPRLRSVVPTYFSSSV